MKNLELELADELFNAVGKPAENFTMEELRNSCVILVRLCIDADNVRVIHNFIEENKNKKK